MPNKISEKIFRHFAKKDKNQYLVHEYLRKKRKVEVGAYSYGGCMSPGFNIGGEVVVGRYCSIANDVHYFGANHPLEYISTSAYFYNKKFGLNVKDVPRSKLIIGNDVWIGYGTLITMNCKTIGNGAVIGGGCGYARCSSICSCRGKSCSYHKIQIYRGEERKIRKNRMVEFFARSDNERLSLF